MYRRENQRQYELRADTISECKAWIDAIKMARYGRNRYKLGLSCAKLNLASYQLAGIGGGG